MKGVFYVIASLPLLMYLSSCANSDNPTQVTAPTVTTSPVTAVTATSAACGGHVFSGGEGSITARGVVWDTSENPTVSSNKGKTIDGSGTGSFTSSITGLSSSTTYYVRSYAAYSSGTSYGEGVSFTTTCEMVEFADQNFKAYCVRNFDTDGDGMISIEEASVVKEIICPNQSITSLKGIEYFTSLTKLDVSNNNLSNLDVSKNTQLSELNCDNNQLSNLDVTKNTQLSELNCDNNQLSNLDVTKNTQLSELNCDNNQLANLDVTTNTQLSELNCDNNQLSNLDVTKNTQLSELNCDNNQLSNLDVTTNKQLTELSFDNNQLSSIDVSQNVFLTTLECNDNNLESLDVSYNGALEYLDCGNGDGSQSASSSDGNHITILDVSQNTKLSTLLFYVDYEATVVMAYGQEIDDFGYNPDNTTVEERPYIPEAVDLGLSVKWASCNVGALNPEEYGGYYAWGETETKSSYYWSTYKHCDGSYDTMTKYCMDSSFGRVDDKLILDPEDDVAHVEWGGSWRMPTKAEIDELVDNCSSEWTELNGVKGKKFTSNKNGNSIFMPAAGFRRDSSLYSESSYGYYWSASLGAYYPYYAWGMYFNSSNISRHNDYRCDGRTVRPVSD